MLKVFAGKIIDRAVINGAIGEERREECAYGLNVFLTTLLNAVSAVVIGLFTGMLIEIVIFIGVYKFLRKYAGGYHAETAKKCYVFSCVVYVTAVLLMRLCANVNTLIVSAFVLCSAFLLLCISPVAAKNKPLDDAEKKVFGRRARINILIVAAVFFALSVIEWEYAHTLKAVAAVGLFLVAALAAAGKIMEKRQQKLN